MSNKPEYQFTGEVKKKIESFKGYLKSQHEGGNTIRQKTNYAGYFLKWLESEHLQAEQTRYNDLLNFVDYCRLEGDALSGVEGKSKAHVNRIIASIREYYKFLRIENPGIINPAMGLYLKGTRRKIVSGIIAFEELESIYHGYPTETTRQKRNKVILGLLVYQSANTEDLKSLEPGHVKLKEGKIYIPGNHRRNGRILELKPFQILELYEYLNETMSQILAEIEKPKPARKPDKINENRIKDQLFVSINGSENIKNSLLHLFRDVQKINPNITNAKQIRQSTITHWLKTHNLRQVQYMSGHKYVSSTELYQTNKLDNLQSKLEKYHPLR
jgi:integrase/recombinase XerD